MPEQRKGESTSALQPRPHNEKEKPHCNFHNHTSRDDADDDDLGNRSLNSILPICTVWCQSFYQHQKKQGLAERKGRGKKLNSFAIVSSHSEKHKKEIT